MGNSAYYINESIAASHDGREPVFWLSNLHPHTYETHTWNAHMHVYTHKWYE